MEKENMEKAKKIYDVLDNSDFYKPFADKSGRSIMNVTFNLKSVDLEAKFVEEAKNNNMINLKGHRVLGGIRASIYNAVSMDAVNHLCNFMEKFEKENK